MLLVRDLDVEEVGTRAIEHFLEGLVEVIAARHGPPADAEAPGYGDKVGLGILIETGA
jgi:hypothetical protein